MPELPDLLYIQAYLQKNIVGKQITSSKVLQPVIVRNGLNESFEGALSGRKFEEVGVRGPFLLFSLSQGITVAVNLMLAGRLQHQLPGEKAEGFRCCSFALNDAAALHICDDKLMAKLYVVRNADLARVPRYQTQGMDILSPRFTLEVFRDLAAKHGRKQVRVFVNDQTILSAIGNAYADEILFEARIHPKTFLGRLKPDEIDALFRSIQWVIAWGRENVEKAARPIQIKVRDHMRVRNRKGKPCPRCGTTIRREGVRGHDVFFCPACQPASRKLFIDWSVRP